MPVLSLWTPLGGVLGITAPLGLAASAGTALVVDLDPIGPRYPGDASLARLASAGPRRADLRPSRKGVAVLRNGGIGPDDCRGLIRALCDGWPAVVLRLGSFDTEFGPWRRAMVLPLLPGPIIGRTDRPAVYQRCGWRVRARGPGPVLPRPTGPTLRALLEGGEPGPSRWIRAWRTVWDHPWT